MAKQYLLFAKKEIDTNKQADNDFINGQNIVIDGGMTKKMIYQDDPFMDTVD